MAITIKDVARESGVNVSTVSRALNGEYGVHAGTREHVLAIAKRLHYRPNRVARGLVTGRSHSLALVVSDIRNPFFAEVARGAEDAAYAADYDLVLCNSDLDAEKQLRYVQSLMEKRVDGILMNSVAALSKKQVEQLSGFGVPIVLLNRAAPRNAFSTVCADNDAGGALAGEYLWKLGHRKIAHLTGPRHHGNMTERAEGFVRSLAEARKAVKPVILHGKNNFQGGVELAEKLLAQHPDITAIFAASDMMAFGVIRALMDAGRRIPEDVSVMGFDNVELSTIVNPPLTTVHQPKYEIGQAAVEILLRLAGRGEHQAPEHRLFGVQLVGKEKLYGAPGMMNRRELLQSAGLAFASSQVQGHAQTPGEVSTADWLKTCRVLICEAYNPPFYPSLDYKAEKAVSIATTLNADSMRYPAASYFAYFPTKSGYPVHPELNGDPFRETVDLCKKNGMRVVAYVPLNHPFMDASSKDPRYADWSKKFADGTPMTTEHYGFAKYFEGCLNSPVRAVIQALVREVLTQYPVDVMYFDGPYQGMNNAKEYCHCKYCEAAYQKRFGKPVPTKQDDVEYTQWMANEVVIAFLHEIREMIRTTRDVPTLFNDTSLLSKREWRNRAIPVVDGFMFEAAETPEDKLFNLQLGHSTGKTIWTYVGTHTQYNREHMKSDRVRGWFSYPVESQEVLIDGATALAGGAGVVYWGLSRFFYMPEKPLAYESGRYVKENFDFSREHQAIFAAAGGRPLAGVMVSDQTIDWFTGKHYVSKGYENYYHGAWQVMKDLGYDSEPFLDYLMKPEQLARYRLVYVPNAACLSDAQCGTLRDYVTGGGTLIATHLTSVADEHGRMRANFGLADLFGAKFTSVEPVEIPDLYLKLPGGELIPQDPQVLRFVNTGDGEVLAETIDIGHRGNLGPAIVKRAAGKGTVIYIGSGLEAIYAETRMKRLRAFLGSLIDPVLAPYRSYEVEYRSGLMPQLMASRDTILLHLVADTGNKTKKLRIREEFLPVDNVKVRVRVPDGRTVRSVSLMRAGTKFPASARAGWVELTVPRVLIHEAVRVDLA